MSKQQTILALLVFLVVLFSVDMLFGNNIMETFRGASVNAPIRNVRPIATSRFVDVPRYVIDADDGPLNYRFFG